MTEPHRDPTYGPAYDARIDGARVSRQMESIRDYMLHADWRTLAEIEVALEHPQASISAQLRHLRKRKFGGYDVDKRRRQPEGAEWEYRVREPFGLT